MTKIEVAAGTTRPPSGQQAVGSRWRRYAPLAVLMCGTFMIVLDFFVVNVALPSMQASLRVGASSIEWVVAGYGLSFAVLLIAAGRLGDRFGRRRMFSAGLALFVLASALCGLATGAWMLVAARVFQGVGGALISPNVLSIMGVTYPGADRVRAITVYGMVMGVAAAGGQLIGGALIAANLFGLGWRAVFLINVPVGLAALGCARVLIPESRAGQAARLDLRGMLLVTAGLTALVLPLVEGASLHWPVWTWATLAASPAIFAAFAASQVRASRRGGAPLLDPALFRRRALAAGLVTQLAFWCGQAALFLVLALYLQQGRGQSPLHAGLEFSILAVSYLAASLRAPALTLRLGRELIAVGALALAAGEGLLLLAVAEAGSGPVAWLAPGLVLAGAGMGLGITPLTTIVMAHADPQRAGAVAGALSTMQQVGNALGVAVTGLIFFGSLASGYGRAFELSLLQLGCLLLAVAAVTRLLPGRAAR
jgi:EmrB/QacA subfamily drug resistance transporter